MNFCLACKSSEPLLTEYGLISLFFATRVMLSSKTSVVKVLECPSCGSKFFDIDISSKQLSRLYDGYRGEKYFNQRNGFEPWYTRKINDDIGSNCHTSQRRKVLVEALAFLKLDNNFEFVLDHGGDRGQMLSGNNADEAINSKIKAVYDISGAVPENGIKSISYDEMIHCDWDLILSCHVLEHLSNPQDYIEDLVNLGRKGTVYVFEVPDETWKILPPNRSIFQLKWLLWITKSKKFIKWIHLLSLIFKLKFRFIPPFLFPSLVEHLNFFSPIGLSKLLQNSNLHVLTSYVGKAKHIVAIAVKK